eukprot:TRINITY_DN6614_c0_g1_i1.p1 TRINITY_DN6614_c0_g1~~TRINITY_DN6614_c0_g1_i1.p1  ORF type:complete len:213 (-),score=18.56 TRINITY_DN6614_c0_g1_i1:25-663(-)
MASSGLTEAFSKLDELLQAGILSDEEYATRKDSLVNSFVGVGGKSAAPSSQAAAPAEGAVGTVLPDGQPQLLCSVHDKLRTISNLEETGTGPDGLPTYSCLAHSQCRPKEARNQEGVYGMKRAPPGGAYIGYPPPKRPYGGPVYGRGAYGAPAYGPTGGRGGRGKGFGGRAPQTQPTIPCATHGKLRTVSNLTQDHTTGEYFCQPHTACRSA